MDPGPTSNKNDMYIKLKVILQTTIIRKPNVKIRCVVGDVRFWKIDILGKKYEFCSTDQEIFCGFYMNYLLSCPLTIQL